MNWLSFGIGVGATLLAEFIVLAVIVTKKVIERSKEKQDEIIPK